jgi:hypothetical protein
VYRSFSRMRLTPSRTTASSSTTSILDFSIGQAPHESFGCVLHFIHAMIAPNYLIKKAYSSGEIIQQFSY